MRARVIRLASPQSRERGTKAGVKISAAQRAARAAILDVDGTLIDSVDVNALARQEALAAYDHRIAFRSILNQIGKGGDQLLPRRGMA